MGKRKGKKKRKKDEAHSHSEHEHEHGHGHAHDHPREARAALERGAGRGKTLFFDAFSGIAGDMTIAALLDLGVPLSVIEQAVGTLPLKGYRLAVGHAHRSGIVATTFDVLVEKKQPERRYGEIDRMLAGAELEPNVAALARRIFRRLGEAEAQVHQTALADVHFHEVGAVDAIVDVVGAAAALSWLEAELVVSPLPMGRGFVQAQHGILPLPAPATVSCLAGAPTYSVELEAELVTPTGAAIAATAASRWERWPAFAPERSGFGAGKRELSDRPNVLRAVLGGAAATIAVEAAGTHELLEANVDDLTGELAAHAIAQLLASGAVDAWATPVTMKKGRPGLVLAALAPQAAVARVADTMLRETSTIGLRRTPVSRIERPRHVVDVSTRFGILPVKVSDGPGGPPQVKPEIDACARAAAAHDVPLRTVLEEALAAYRSRG